MWLGNTICCRDLEHLRIITPQSGSNYKRLPPFPSKDSHPLPAWLIVLTCQLVARSIIVPKLETSANMPFKLQNPWKENLKDTPKESLNWRLWYGVLGRILHITMTVVSADHLQYLA